MCGVIGYIPKLDQAEPSASQAKLAFWKLLNESKVRGTHAYGLAQMHGTQFEVHREIGDYLTVVEQFNPFLPAVAHTRYSTSGDWKNPENNQPLIVQNLALAWNGVIHMGTKEEFERDYEVSCETYNDGEVFLRKLLAGIEPSDFLSLINGSFAGAWLHGKELYVGRNERRPLWRARQYGARWYASTRDIFLRAGFSEGLEEVQVGVWRG